MPPTVRASRARQRNLPLQAPVGCVLLDGSNTALDLSQTAGELYRRSREKVELLLDANGVLYFMGKIFDRGNTHFAPFQA
jgi:hypothetical protein